MNEVFKKLGKLNQTPEYQRLLLEFYDEVMSSLQGSTNFTISLTEIDRKLLFERLSEIEPNIRELRSLIEEAIVLYNNKYSRGKRNH